MPGPSKVSDEQAEAARAAETAKTLLYIAASTKNTKTVVVKGGKRA